MPKLANDFRRLSNLVFFVSLILSGCAAQTSGTGVGKTLALDQSYKYKIVTAQTLLYAEPLS